LKRNAKGSNSRFKVPRIDYRGSSNRNVALKKNKRSWAKLEAKFEICEGRFLVDLPIRTVSEANSFERWQVKYSRHQAQKREVSAALIPHRGLFRLPCRIFLTRFAPESLDKFDNLPMSFKYIVDCICAIITGEYRAGKADSDDRISIACDQVKSEAYGIRIEITY